MNTRKKSIKDIAGAGPQGNAQDPAAIAAAVSTILKEQLSTRDQQLTAALSRPANIRALESKLDAMLSTKDGQAQIADLLYGAGSLELSKAIEGSPLEKGWWSDVKKGTSTNVKVWHVPLYMMGAGALFVIAKRMGWTDSLAEMFGIE